LKTNPKEVVAYIVSIIVLVGFAVFIVHLLNSTAAAELQWQRAVYLFSGVEAIAFAAAGFLFGREINRKRAERAEKEGDTAKQEAKTAEKNALRGKALFEYIKAKAEGQRDKAEPYGALGGDKAQQVIKADFKEMETYAKGLFSND
jgi:uncharacterized integral membrane protein